MADIPSWLDAAKASVQQYNQNAPSLAPQPMPVQPLGFDPLAPAPILSPEELLQKQAQQDAAEMQQKAEHAQLMMGAGPLPEAAPEEFAKAGLNKALDDKIAVKNAAEKAAIADKAALDAEVAKNAEADQHAYQAKLAEVVAENEKRAMLGLQPKPLPAAPAVLAPTKVDESVPEQVLAKALTPDEADHAEAAKQHLEPVRKQIAVQAAVDKAQEEQNAFDAAQALRVQQAQQAIDEIQQKQNQQVRQLSLTQVMNQGSFGQKLGASLAVLLGGIAQGSAGYKTNPVIDFIDNALEKQAAQDKLDASQKESLRHLLLQEADAKIRQLSERTSNEFKKGQLEVMRGELAVKQQEANFRQQDELRKMLMANKAGLMAGKNLSWDELQQVDPKQKSTYVLLPDGRYGAAVSSEAAKELRDFQGPARDALGAIKRIQDLAKQYSVGEKINPYDPETVRIKGELIGLIGGLRIPYTGPGILSPDEYKRLQGVVGDPTKFFTNPAAEAAALSQVGRKINGDLTNRYQNSGVNLGSVDAGLTKDAEYVSALQKSNPGMSDSKALDVIEKLRAKGIKF